MPRSISDTIAVAPPTVFRSSLTSYQNPSFLAPLGHLVDPDGPGGVVDGLASSVGDPVPYAGVDELRVPDRPRPPPGPAVQRRTATLRPDSPVMPDREDAVPDDGSGPAAIASESSLAPTIDAGMITEAPTVGLPAETLSGRSRPPVGGAPPSSTTPLTVPVQRSAVASSTGPKPQVDHVASAAALTPVPTTSTTGAAVREAALDPPNPPAMADLVLARSALDSTDRHPDRPSKASEVPVLASPPPLVASAPGAGPTLQRRLADPATSLPSAPNLASSLPLVPVTGPVSPPAAAPDVATGVTTSPRMLDELGYPPLVARSVPRRAVDAEAARPSATSRQSDLDPVSTPPQAPLSGFTAAISALHDPAPAAPLSGSGAEPQVHPGGVDHDSALVVARRLPPDQSGRLPAPEARLQRSTISDRPAPLPGTGQRSLIAGLSPVASSTSTASRTATTTAPAVQRLRYEDVTGPSEGRLGLEQPAGAAEPWIGTGEPSVAPMMPSAPWSPVLPASSSDGAGWSSAAPSGTSGSSHLGAHPAVLQRTATGTGRQHTASRASHPAAETPPYPRTGEASASLVSPDVPSSDPPPMIQRRFDAPAPSAPVTPPASAHQPTMAVSGRSVGLAEMFAMAAAQSTAGEATVQRSPETAVQLTSFDSGPSDAGATGSTGAAAPPPPATAARPPSGAELEEMARRLYEPLSARLRAELWQDRERSGLLTDLRP